MNRVNDIETASVALSFTTSANIGSYARTLLSVNQGGTTTARLGVYGSTDGLEPYVFLSYGKSYSSADTLRIYTDKVTWKGHEILTSAGGTITGTDNYPLIIKSGTAEYSGIRLMTSERNFITFGYKYRETDTIPDMFLTDKNGWSKEYYILHSGNVGDYYAGGIVSLGSPESDVFADYIAKYGKGVTSLENATGAPVGTIGQYDTILNIGKGAFRFGRFIFTSGSTPLLYFQTSNNSGNGWGDKKTIAFTDSTVAAATRLEDGNGKYIAYVDANNSRFYIGDNINPTTDMYLLGRNIQMRYGTNGTTGFILNSSGNVTIGSQDLAGTNAKLYVDGDIKLKASIPVKIGSAYSADNNNVYNYIEFNSAQNGIRYYGGTWASTEGEIAHQFVTTASLTKALTILNSGNILIGTTDDNGAKLQVAGSSYFSKTAEFKNAIFANRYSDSVGASIVINKGGDYFGIGASASNSMNLALGLTSDLNGTWKEEKIIIGSDTTTINGDLRVKGNIIADGEVAAGGAGTEGSGGSAGGSGNIVSLPLERGRNSYDITHGLDTWDVMVSIYEQNANDGSWDMILTDVKITGTNTINVSFGSDTDVDHKVVIMGAVA